MKSFVFSQPCSWIIQIIERIWVKVPRSVLWLLRFPFHGEQHVHKYAAERGLDPKRVVFSNVAAKVRQIFFFEVYIYLWNCNFKEKIVFEITERETVKNFSLLEKFVHNLKSDGYKFAIDDFGSGFSSFHYIKKFPIDYVKIDGDFIININKDRSLEIYSRDLLLLNF